MRTADITRNMHGEFCGSANPIQRVEPDEVRQCSFYRWRMGWNSPYNTTCLLRPLKFWYWDTMLRGRIRFVDEDDDVLCGGVLKCTVERNTVISEVP
jgi:hypothetical protein